MIWGMYTAWLYSYSSTPGNQQNTFYTVFVDGPREPKMNGQSVMAQISLSYLTTLSEQGAGALVHSYTPPFGPDVEFHDFKYNAVWAPNALAVTFALSASGAEAYAQGRIFVFEETSQPMESDRNASTPPAAEPAYSVAVYDAKTGEVLLIHHFGAMPGIELPQSEQLHEMALRHAARRHKREPESMHVLKIDVSAIERKRTYRVALPDRVLVAAPAGKRRR